MVLMEDTVLDTALILWDMVMVILAILLLGIAMDMVLAIPGMGMESVLLRLNQRLMLFMDPIVGTGMNLDIVHTPWDMAMDMVMATVMDIMVKLPATNNQELNLHEEWSRFG